MYLYLLSNGSLIISFTSIPSVRNWFKGEMKPTVNQPFLGETFNLNSGCFRVKTVIKPNAVANLQRMNIHVPGRMQGQ